MLTNVQSVKKLSWYLIAVNHDSTFYKNYNWGSTNVEYCSSCGKVATDRWISERLSDILPVEYHHLVFTLPWQLRIVCLVNRKVMFDIFFNAVNKSIQSWTKEYGNYVPGFYIVHLI